MFKLEMMGFNVVTSVMEEGRLVWLELIVLSSYNNEIAVRDIWPSGLQKSLAYLDACGEADEPHF